jgi:lipopolysaccharide transport system ATP-binding protein
MIFVEAEIESTTDIQNVSVSFLVRDATGVDILGTTTFDERMTLPPLERDRILRIRFAFKNQLRAGTYGVCVALNRVSRRDYTDNILLDQIDGSVAFGVIENPNRPVHYKIHQPVEIEVLSREARAAVHRHQLSNISAPA